VAALSSGWKWETWQRRLDAVALAIAGGEDWLQPHANELKAINAEIKKGRPEVEAVEKLQKQKEALKREISELEKIKGLKTEQIEQILGYKYSDEVIHRDDLVVL
jgi:glutamate 5-kinase